MSGRIRPRGRRIVPRLRRRPAAPGTVDALTGLPVRDGLLRAADPTAGPDDGVLAVLVVDVDGMKEVNDAFGHEVGDRLLVACADRLVSELGPAATVARLGGDEFAAVVSVADETAARAVVRRVTAALTRPVSVRGLDIPTTSSVGFAVAGLDGDDLSALLAAADQRMYAGRTGGPTPGARVLAGDDASGAAALLADLSRAIRARSPELRLHYQPQVAAPGTAGAEVVGLAACARWEHPRLGPLPASAFVPLAERSGLAAALDEVLLATALRDWPVLRSRMPCAHLTVTLSTHTLFAPGLGEQLTTRLSRAGVDGADLRLSVGPFATGLAPRSRSALERLGIGLSVQGYGTTRSSVTTLWRQPLVREVRLHPPLMAHLPRTPEARRLVKGLVDAAHGLGFTVLAAQLEESVVAECLSDLGCDVLQGFWLAPPLGLLDVAEWVDYWDRTGTPPVVRSGLQE